MHNLYTPCNNDIRVWYHQFQHALDHVLGHEITQGHKPCPKPVDLEISSSIRVTDIVTIGTHDTLQWSVLYTQSVCNNHNNDSYILVVLVTFLMHENPFTSFYYNEINTKRLRDRLEHT